LFYYLIYFFFQAEDGIRDYKVTGVQTCALPISRMITRSSRRLACSTFRNSTSTTAVSATKISYAAPTSSSPNLATASSSKRLQRSEERRVGKEWRCRRAECNEKHNEKWSERCAK